MLKGTPSSQAMKYLIATSLHYTALSEKTTPINLSNCFYQETLEFPFELGLFGNHTFFVKHQKVPRKILAFEQSHHPRDLPIAALIFL